MIKGIQYNAETGETTEVELDIVLPNPRIMEIENRMREITNELKSLDYKTTKFVEGALTEAEFTEVKNYKNGLRTEYNTLELEMANLI